MPVETNETLEDLESSPQSSSFNPIGGQIPIHPAHASGSLTPTARCIMDELKDWHKRVEKHGSKEIHASYLLTLDKVSDALNKYTNLSPQGKTPDSVFHAIKLLIDYEKRGERRVCYIYPYLLRNGNKLSARIALIAPQKDGIADASQYRDACFNMSREQIDTFLDTRTKKLRPLDPAKPGSYLLPNGKDGNPVYVPSLGSIESEIGSILKKGFSPYPYIPMNDFIADFIKYGVENKKLLFVVSGYHIIIDQLELNADGSFKKNPEILNQLIAHTDALENYCHLELKKKAEEQKYETFLGKLSEYFTKFSASNKAEFNETATVELISLAKSFPFERSTTQASKKTQEIIEKSIRILEKLIQEKHHLLQRKDGSVYDGIRNSVSTRIEEWTKNNNTLMPISFEDEVLKNGVRDDNKIAEYKQKLKEDISSKFAYHEEINESGKPVSYVVDPGYMALVLHKLTSDSKNDPNMKSQLNIAKRINNKLSNPKDPNLNAKLRPDQMVKLMADVSNIEKEEEEMSRSQEFQSKFNLVPGILAFFASMLGFLAASFSLGTIVPLIVGIPISLVVGFVVAIFFREKPDSEIHEDVMNSSKMQKFKESLEKSPNTNGGKSKDSNTDPKNNKLVSIANSADAHIFPKKFNKITDKVMDLKTLRQRIYDNLDDIKRKNPHLSGEKDPDKVASTVEYALLQSSAVIQIPEDIQILNMPSAIYVSKNDLKTSLFRSEVANAWREEMNKKKFDKKLVKYYTYLINTFEMEYHRYLPKKKL